MSMKKRWPKMGVVDRAEDAYRRWCARHKIKCEIGFLDYTPSAKRVRVWAGEFIHKKGEPPPPAPRLLAEYRIGRGYKLKRIS